MPHRVQRKRTKGWRMPAETVSVCRPGVFGNPFVGLDAVAVFRKWLKADNGTTAAEQIDFERALGGAHFNVELAEPAYRNLPNTHIRESIDELRGKDLACFCALDKPCHADVLLEIANR